MFPTGRDVVGSIIGVFLFFVIVGILDQYGYLDPILDYLEPIRIRLGMP